MKRCRVGSGNPMVTTTHRTRDWRAAGACLHADPDLFFPISSAGRAAAQIAEAKAVCARCPVIRECLAFATEHPWLSGIWGGTTFDDRQRVRRQRRRAERVSALRQAGGERP